MLLWSPSHGPVKVGQPSRTNVQQLCADTGCNLEDPRGRLTIEMSGNRRSETSMLAGRHDDDDDDDGSQICMNF